MSFWTSESHFSQYRSYKEIYFFLKKNPKPQPQTKKPRQTQHKTSQTQKNFRNAKQKEKKIE